MGRLVTPTDTGGENICIYGPSGTSKTRLACSAMRAAPDVWGDKALYIAVDPGSWKLKSILKQDRPHLIPYVLQPEDGGIYDPYDEMIKALYRNDLGEYQTVIFDTVSVFARELLQAISNSGKFSDKHVEIYKGKRKLNMAMMGDYGATHQCVLDVLGAIKDTGKNMIVVAHDQMVEPDADESGPTIVGPATVGKALVGPLAGWFDTTIRTEARLSKQAPSNPLTPREVEYWVVTEARKPYLAKIRISTPTNPISEFKLNPDPSNFWIKLKEIQ